MRQNFDQLLPVERRLILVATDDVYARLARQRAIRSALMALLTGATGIGASAYLAATMASAGFVAMGRLGVGAFLLRHGEIPVPHLTPVEAARRFQFDLGGPEDGTAYLLNPCRPDHYIRPALANERFAQEKLAAFLHLVSALGGKEVHLLDGHVSDRNWIGKGRIPLPDAAAQLRLHARFANGASVERSVVGKFAEPTAEPVLPEAVKPWLSREPILDAMTKTRLEGQVEELSASLVFSEETDAGAKVCAELADWGINVGGKYHAVSVSRWDFQVTFWPKRPAKL